MNASLNASARAPAFAAKIAAPFAVLGLRTNGSALTALHYLPLGEREAAPLDRVAGQAAHEIARWLEDPDFRFSIALAPEGTAFRHRVWAALQAIPRGQSRTYGDVARLVGSAPRAVGQACGDNPIPLIIPCHRVVGANGALGGFMHAGDGNPIAIKRWLLAHEGVHFPA